MSRGSQLGLLLLLCVLTHKAFSQETLEVSEGHNIILEVSEGDNVTLEVSEGHNIILPCTTTEKIKDIRKVTVVWKKSDSYVLVFRSGKPYPDDQDEQFENRAAVADPELKNGNLSLILNNTQLNDTGVYECLFFGAKSRMKRAVPKLITSVTLNVTAFSQKPLEVSKGDNVTLEVSEGHDVTLPCTTTEKIQDINKVTVEWKKNGSYVLVFHSQPKPTRDPQFTDRAAVADPELKNGNLSLILSNTQLNDSGVYQCRFVKSSDLSRQKRAASDPKLITSVTLKVTAEGSSSGHEAGQGHVILGLIAAGAAVTVVVFVSAAGVFLYKRENKSLRWMRKSTLSSRLLSL